MGEPAGIGAEICYKSLTNSALYDICRPIIFGDWDAMKDAIDFSKGVEQPDTFELVRIPFDHEIDFDAIDYEFGKIHVFDFDNVDLSKLEYGVDSAMGGKAAGDYIESAIEMALEHRIHATATAPISKPAFQMGGWGLKYPGHTEMFADLTDTHDYTMMLAHDNFRVVHVSTHVPLRKAVDLVKKDRVLKVIKLGQMACQLFGIGDPKVAVCGLNPHSGENGRMGHEEIDEIIPAIEEAKALNINVTGPVPADTMWSKVRSGFYDIGVAMYHDQGHIPTKLLGFQYNSDGTCTSVEGINTTVGIPIIRVSVDHGTAYDKAGQGTATAASLNSALKIAAELAVIKYDL